MPEVTFDQTDNPAAQEAQQQAEAKALAVGEKIIAEQEQAEQEVYENARKQAESQLQYAGKFRSAEDLEKAYLELEKKLGQSKTQTEESSDDAADDEDDGDAQAEVHGQEGEQDGQEREQVDEGDEGEQPAEEGPRITPDQEKALLDEVGGLDTYNQALLWAGESFTQPEINTFNSLLATGDPGVVEFAVKGLVTRFKNNGDFEGQQFSGKAIRGQGAKPFRSQAELAEAIGSPKYRNDPAYRLDVEARLAVSGELL